MIFSHQEGAKQFKVRLNSSRNCSVSVRITFDGMESLFARFSHVFFNFGMESLEQSVKLDRLVILISLAIQCCTCTTDLQHNEEICIILELLKSTSIIQTIDCRQSYIKDLTRNADSKYPVINQSKFHTLYHSFRSFNEVQTLPLHCPLRLHLGAPLLCQDQSAMQIRSEHSNYFTVVDNLHGA